MTVRGPGSSRADIKRFEASDVPCGNGDFWITATDGTNYAAPALIAHYIDAHAYLSPASFVEAVIAGAPTEGLS